MGKQENKKEGVGVSAPPTGLQVIFREFKKDKLAMFALISLVIVIVGVFIWARFIDQETLMRVSLRDKFAPPGDKLFLCADKGGKYILGQLLI